MISTLLDKLTDIERALGRETETMIRYRIIDAQDHAVLIQKQVVEELRIRSGSLIDYGTYKKTA
jgi:hypothetical protein